MAFASSSGPEMRNPNEVAGNDSGANMSDRGLIRPGLSTVKSRATVQRYLNTSIAPEIGVKFGLPAQEQSCVLSGSFIAMRT